MSFSLHNLDAFTRSLMLDEVNSDLANGKLYISPRLSDIGKADYPHLLQQAIEQHDEVWLASQLQMNNRMNSKESRQTQKGTTLVTIPHTAPYTLAEGEFNRFYIRGVCLRAEQEGISTVVVYRAKPVENPRPESQAKIGTSVSVSALLRDLRNSVGVDTALGLPAGPNSGLTVRLP